MQRFILAAATVAGLATALPAAAQFQKPEDAVKYRQSAMFVIGQHFSRVGAMVQGKAPYDAAAAAANIEVVASLAKLPFAGFVEGTSSTEKGKAKAAIWSDRAKFDSGAKAMQDAMVKLVAATKSNSLDTLKPAFGEVGKTCKGCHDDFRNQ
ncbi:Cytochrome c' [Rubrivivax sp. A210]|uniref:c-type cytochrome n=1 Tax=Rubrivivax sp. A210 TaxID=2772301 RepID=UPI001919C3F7|nr:cytochrome c [Rubrivivax sp. A210]CAD5370155.1 Cytochrome c' [Rubrivivax sp. A210]